MALCAAAAAGCAGASAPDSSAHADAPSIAVSRSPSSPSSTATSASPSGAAATSGTTGSTPVSTAGDRRSAPAAAIRIKLAPTRLPGYTAESWTAETAGPVRSVTGHDVELNECATVHGASTWQQQPYQSSGGNSAILEAYTFPGPAQANSAFAETLSGMRGCQATSRILQSSDHIAVDAVSRETASATDAAAFERIWTGVEGVSATGHQTNHLYLAVSGSEMLVLHFDELVTGDSAGPYDIRNDPGVLTMLKSLLTNHAG